MQANPARYRALPYIFSAILVLLGAILNRWQITARQAATAEFSFTPFVSYNVIAPLLFALIGLLLFASVFNHRLTLTGSLVLLLIGLLVCLLPVWTIFTAFGRLMPMAVSNYMPLSGAVIAAAGFGGLVLRKKTA